eukprot:1088_1
MDISSILVIFVSIITASFAYYGPETEDYFRAMSDSNRSWPDNVRHDSNRFVNWDKSSFRYFHWDKPNQTEFATTNSSSPVHYYTIINQGPNYNKIIISTCCPYITDLNREWCDSSSLDTILYYFNGFVTSFAVGTENEWLQVRKQWQLESSDDFDACSNPLKSQLEIDLTYTPGFFLPYTFAVGGYASETGKYKIHVTAMLDVEIHSEEWFQEQYKQGSINASNMNELTCGTIDSAIMDHRLIHYYKLKITREMNEIYTTDFSVSTCCTHRVCESYLNTEDNVFSFDPSFYNYSTNLTACYLEWDKYPYMWAYDFYHQNYPNATAYSCCLHYNFINDYGYIHSSSNVISNNLFLDYYQLLCSRVSLDTVIYILQETDDSIELVQFNESAGDSCSNSQKSKINLTSFEATEYIVAIAGGSEGRHVGSYRLELNCQQYSFPLKHYQFRPKDVTHLPPCNTYLYEQQNTEMKAMSYYTFSVSLTSNSAVQIVLTSLCRWRDMIMYLFTLTTSGQFALVDFKDTSFENCSNVSDISTTLNVTDHGQYYIGVQGFFNEPRNFSIGRLCTTTEPTTTTPTFKYSFPATRQQFNQFIENETITPINCETTMSQQRNSYDKLVSYYVFNITDQTLPPIIISTCPPHGAVNEIDAHIYILRKLDDGNVIIVTQDESTGASCDALSAEIDISHLLEGEYFAVIQGDYYKFGNFSISMSCEEPPRPISKEVVMGAVFGTCGTLLLLFIIYYLYEWQIYCKRNKHCCYSDKLQHIDSSVPRSTAADQHTLIPQEDDVDETSNNVTYTCCLCHSVTFERATEDENEYESIETRRIDQDTSLAQQVGDHEDVVQLVLYHALKCCEDQDGFDIYQVLALRYYDRESRTIRGRKPFKRIGCDCEVIAVSPFMQAAFIALVIGLAQTFGTSVVVWRLVYPFLQEGITDDTCVMDASRWNALWSLKMLSFIFSLIILFHISIQMNKLEHSGLYEMVEKLTVEHMERVDRIVLWILQIGQGINYYVCFLAVAGSYFIVWSANEGEIEDDGTIDYSEAALDMILNAVALFFMLEVDQHMVTTQDYHDCEQHLQRIIHAYCPDISLNVEYSDDVKKDFVCCCYERTKTKVSSVAVSDLYTMNDLDPDITKWTNNDVIYWILSLEEGRYQPYANGIRAAILKQEIDGSCFGDIKQFHLESWNIHKFKDRIALFDSMHELQFNENKMDDGRVENIDQDDGKSDDSEPLETDAINNSEQNGDSIDIDNYTNWTEEQVVDWIIAVMKGFNVRYDRETMIEVAKMHNISGRSLNQMERRHLKNLGVHDARIRNAIYQQIQIQFKNNGNYCLKHVVPILSFALNVVSVVVKVGCYGGGFVAPFLIFFCW